MCIYFATDKIPNELKRYCNERSKSTSLKPDRYLPLLETILFSSDITLEDGTQISADELENKLEGDTISYSGEGTSFMELSRLSLSVEVKKYEDAVRWLRDIAYSGNVVVKKIKNRIAAMKLYIPENMRDPGSISQSIEADMLFEDSSTTKHQNTLNVIQWLPELERLLNRDQNLFLQNVQKVKDIRRSGKRFFMLLTTTCSSGSIWDEIFCQWKYSWLVEPEIYLEEIFQPYKGELLLLVE